MGDQLFYEAADRGFNHDDVSSCFNQRHEIEQEIDRRKLNLDKSDHFNWSFN